MIDAGWIRGSPPVRPPGETCPGISCRGKCLTDPTEDV
jgi:hypothetical protein